MATLDYAGWLERARQRRERYDQESIERAQQADRAGYSNPNMFSNETRTTFQNNRSRGMAQPQWEAWFQAAQEASPAEEMPVFGAGVSPSQHRRRASIQALLRGQR